MLRRIIIATLVGLGVFALVSYLSGSSDIRRGEKPWPSPVASLDIPTHASLEGDELSPKLQELSDELRQAKKKGLLNHNIPDPPESLPVLEPYPAWFTLARGPKAVEFLRSHGEEFFAMVDVDNLVRLRLVGDPRAFDIERLSPDEPIDLRKKDFGKWYFNITPKKWGTHDLRVMLYVYDRLGAFDPVDPPQSFKVRVHAGPLAVASIFYANWVAPVVENPIVAGVLTALIVLFLTWMWPILQQRSNGEGVTASAGDPKTPPARGGGDAPKSEAPTPQPSADTESTGEAKTKEPPKL